MTFKIVPSDWSNGSFVSKDQRSNLYSLLDYLMFFAVYISQVLECLSMFVYLKANQDLKG